MTTWLAKEEFAVDKICVLIHKTKLHEIETRKQA